MQLPDDDVAFLRDLVKLSRQRSQHVAWVDRDGTKRLTTLTAADVTRLGTIARQLHVSTAEALRQAAHIPTTR